MDDETRDKLREEIELERTSDDDTGDECERCGDRMWLAPDRPCPECNR